MLKDTQFNEIVDEYLMKLDQLILVVTRVHGKNHKELYEVMSSYDELAQKIREDKTADLSGIFLNLRRITSDYTVVDDACEAFASVYMMLSTLDRAYRCGK